jgi:cell division protein FtsB
MVRRVRYLHAAGLVAALALLSSATATFAAGVSDSLDVVSGTNRSAAASQKKIDDLSAQTRALLEEYRRLQDGVEYQAAYTRELEDLEQAQRVQIAQLQGQIAQASITRQRIVPLMRSMADALEKFVVLDLPFQQEERINGVLLLKRHLNQADMSVAAKFRLLLEAYQLEQGYGNTIAAWRGPLQWEGEDLSVEYLRIGRVALYFQTLDGARSGYWNVEQAAWLPLDAGFNRDVTQALRVARNQVAPQLLQLPMLAPGESS